MTGQLTAAVRCLREPVYLHARFHRIDQTTTIDAQLISIDVCGRAAGQLDPVWTGQVTLTGPGVDLLRAGDVIYGDNQGQRRGVRRVAGEAERADEVGKTANWSAPGGARVWVGRRRWPARPSRSRGR